MKRGKNDDPLRLSSIRKYTYETNIIQAFTQSCLKDALNLVIDVKETDISGGNCTPDCVDGFCIQTCYSTIAKVVQIGASRIGAGLGAVPANRSLASRIEHTLLKPDATPEEIEKLCDEAQRFSFFSVVVNPTNLRLATNSLVGSGVLVGTVIGFPLGATLTEVKVFETEEVIGIGAKEVDMVINIGALKAKNHQKVAEEIERVVAICHAHGAKTKVILEVALLTDEEKVIACLLAKEAGANFVKTSTGFGPGVASLEDVALMRRVVGSKIGVKASGGIRTLNQAMTMIDAGATRLGTSASVQIVRQVEAEINSNQTIFSRSMRNV
ncbi:MAG: deoxyribose-phosphate aldolase [Anaerolineales bacterium]|nr:deoxyribose-phosphate aldolase [Anaerolineales bacterium]